MTLSLPPHTGGDRLSEIRLLIADREPSVRNLIKHHISTEGFTTDEAADGIAALKLFRRNDYDMIILDTSLPELDGRHVCRQIRKVSEVPIIIISEQRSEQERLAGFALGADDYLTKPFSPLELLAKIKVFLHRSSALLRSAHQKLACQGLYVDTSARTVYVDERPVQLTPKEYQLLVYLMQNPNKALTRDMLLDEVWGYDFYGSDRTVDTHIKTLRENLKPYQHYIVTVWGLGYKFEANKD